MTKKNDSVNGTKANRKPPVKVPVKKREASAKKDANNERKDNVEGTDNTDNTDNTNAANANNGNSANTKQNEDKKASKTKMVTSVMKMAEVPNGAGGTMKVPVTVYRATPEAMDSLKRIRGDIESVVIPDEPPMGQTKQEVERWLKAKRLEIRSAKAEAREFKRGESMLERGRNILNAFLAKAERSAVFYGKLAAGEVEKGDEGQERFERMAVQFEEIANVLKVHIQNEEAFIEQAKRDEEKKEVSSKEPTETNE